MDESELIAAGWTRLESRGFTLAIGQTWLWGSPGKRRIAFVSSERNANNRVDTVHGGTLLTFADIALGIGAAEAAGSKLCATAQLNYQFAGRVKVGSMVCCEPEVVRMSGRTLFMRALFEADGEVVGSADAIFKVIDPERKT